MKQIVKKKYPVTYKDKKDWITFTKRLENIYDKDTDFIKQNTTENKIRRLDLHGLSLNQANKIVKKFIIESFEGGYKKLLIITGKGLRSKVHKNPYLSEQMNVLKYSVPEFIKNDENLFEKISRISTADLKDGGEGAFYIFFKKVKKSIE
ncbi:MAG: DNA mismatch repair protein MutS [Alphaproteobacteria bacterium]|nr:MAG: DNA mismatch repair protein MutS [Alphaproteobacteria bacterium]RUA20323.1 MAG: DNA mismatch repair protein MutS [Alphaproteobacteria bacterium]